MAKTKGPRRRALRKGDLSEREQEGGGTAGRRERVRAVGREEAEGRGKRWKMQRPGKVFEKRRKDGRARGGVL